MNFKELLEYYLRNPAPAFSVLILGERGTGKTRWVKELSREKLNKKMVIANCASFSDDTLAESILFGYKKGAFTGAENDHKGLFHEANGNVLFFDEVHNLLFRTQEKLMTALQTESTGSNKGKFMFRRLGDVENEFTTFRPIFASNLSLVELKKKLLPDFYDRISQLVVQAPSIHDADFDIYEEFKSVWNSMQFEKHNAYPAINEFRKWLKLIRLPGNYRSLEILAINWHQGRIIFGSDEKKVFDFVKSQFEKYYSGSNQITRESNFNFRVGVSKKELEAEYEYAMLKWAFSEEGYGEKETDVQKGLKCTSRLKAKFDKLNKKS